MSTLETAYGTTNQSITMTFAALATAGMNQATAVVNSSGHLDHIIGGTVTAGAASTSATGTISIYVCPSSDGGTSYAGDASGSSGSYSGKITNAILAKTVDVVANNGVYKFGGISVASVVGNMPERYSLIVLNSSGGTLAAGSVHYVGLKIQSV